MLVCGITMSLSKCLTMRKRITHACDEAWVKCEVKVYNSTLGECAMH